MAWSAGATALGEEISLLWERLGVDEAQQRDFRAAVKLHPRDAQMRFNLGYAYMCCPCAVSCLLRPGRKARAIVSRSRCVYTCMYVRN